MSDDDKKAKYIPTRIPTAELYAELGDPSTWDKDEEEFQRKYKAKKMLKTTETQQTTEEVLVLGGQALKFEVDDYDSTVTLSKTEGKDNLGTLLLYEDQIRVVIEKLTLALKRFEASGKEGD